MSCSPNFVRQVQQKITLASDLGFGIDDQIRDLERKVIDIRACYAARLAEANAAVAVARPLENAMQVIEAVSNKQTSF